MVLKTQLVSRTRKVPNQKDHSKKRGYRDFGSWYFTLGPISWYCPAISMEPIPYNLQHDAVRLSSTRIKWAYYFCQIKYYTTKNVDSKIAESQTETTDLINKKTLPTKSWDVVQSRGSHVYWAFQWWKLWFWRGLPTIWKTWWFARILY